MTPRVDTATDARPGIGTPPSDADTASAAEAFHDTARRIAELQAYAAYFVSTRIDRLKLTARNLIVLAILGVLGLIAGAAIIVTAAVQLLQGIAGAIGALCGDRVWVGDLVCSVVVLAVIAIVVVVGMSRLTKTSRSQTVSKYESRKQQQRRDLGEDVQQRAQYTPSNGISDDH